MAKQIQVLMLQSVRKLGQKDEIVTVSYGHARNYLIPQKLAVIATPELLKKREVKEQKQTEQKKQTASKLQPLLDKVHNEGISFVVPANENGQLFGSVNIHTVEKALVEKFGKEIEENESEIEFVDSDQKALRHVGVYQTQIVFPQLPQKPQTTFAIHIKPLMK